MQENIHHQISHSLTLDGPEVLQTTGRQEYGTRDRTILVDTVTPHSMSGTVNGKWTRFPALRLQGKAVLKAGGLGERSHIEIPLDDERIPQWLRDAMSDLAQFHAALDAHITERIELRRTR